MLYFRSFSLLNVLFPIFFFFFFFPTCFFFQNAAFPEFCTLVCLIFKVFIFLFLASQNLFSRKTLHFRSSALWNVLFPKFSLFDFLASQKLFFRKTLHFRSSALWIVLFPKFSFFDFQLPRSFFSQNASFPVVYTLECLISKVFIFRFLSSQKLFFCTPLNFCHS